MSTPLPSPLAQLLTELGVDPGRARLVRRSAGAPAYLCLPSPERPQLLVPLERWAGVMVAERRARGRRAVAAKQAVSLALTTGLLGRLPVPRLLVDDPALTELARWVGGADGYRLGVLSGPPRANRKPVLRVFTPAGTTWGYAKVGSTPLATELVRHEAAALTHLAQVDLPGLRPPQVLRSGTWRDRAVLVTSPLAGPASHRQPAALPVGPTRTLFSVGARSDLPVSASSVFTGSVPPEELGRPGGELLPLAERLREALGDRRLPLGAAHGDWTPWNMAWTGGVLEAWDWERFATDLPAGHDVVHFESSFVQAADPGPGEERLLHELPGQLSRCGLDPALTHPLLALYLLVVGRRYARDLRREHVSSVAARLDWVIRLLRVTTARVEQGAPA